MTESVGEAALLRVIGAIYDAAATPERWMDVLEQLRAMFGLSFAAKISRNAARTRVEGIAAGVDHDDYQAFLARYFRDSIFAARTRTWRAGEIVTGRALVAPEEFRHTEMYQMFHRPRDLGEGLRVGLALEGGIYRGLGFFRPWQRGPFTPAELALCRTLMPHLRRAVALNERLREADLMATAALAGLDLLPHPVLLLDEDCRVMHANGAAEALLAGADGLTARNGTLLAATPALTERLRATLALAAGDGTGRAGALRLARRGGGPELSVLVMPLRQEPAEALGRHPAVLVCVNDPAAGTAAPGRQMAELFGLTGKEADLATALLAGRSLREIAEDSQRSVNTVRTHLARLMGKTGVHRQSELLRLLAGLPRTETRAP
jgi:DNA-binding CsgD family transcriptional regulator